MGYNISQNLISGHPPLMVFTICLTAFGCTMIVLAYVVGEHEVPNPDVQMDWNQFFKKMSYLKLCPLQNYTQHPNKGLLPIPLPSESTLNSSALHVVDGSKSMSAVLSDVVDSAMANDWSETTFVEMSVKVKFEVRGNIPANTPFSLKGRLRGNLLGLPGKYGHLLYNISLSFRSLENASCDSEKCSFIYQACVSMRLPSELLPKITSPDRCKVKAASWHGAFPIVFSEYPILNSDELSTACIDLGYTPDARLTEMLSPHDRSIVNLHLMHTSYFMFVMVMTLVCYSLIRGRYRQTNIYYALQKNQLDA